MVLPANYNRIMYKFREPDLKSEKDFLKIKATDTFTYDKKIKLRIKKEQLIYLRHHWLSLITYLLSTVIMLVMSLYFLTSWDFELFLPSGRSPTVYIWLFIFLISIITSVVYHVRGFSGSILSFLKYKNEKYKYYRTLKFRIDGCKNYYSYREKYLRIY